MPGDHLPANDPEIKRTVRALVRDTSRRDMYKTVRDIVYSGLLQHMGFEDRNIGLITQRERGEESARVSSVKDIYYVLKNRKGCAHAKARLVCTLARAAGVPARLVMSMDGHVWSQVWINGAGWISIETAYPALDYVRPWRTYMPKLYQAEDYALAALSGRDDDVGRVLWDASVKAYYVKNDPRPLLDVRQIARAKMLILPIDTEGPVGEHARLRMGSDVYVAAEGRANSVELVFYGADGNELKRHKLSFDGLVNKLNVRNQLFWKFVPRRIGDLVVLETSKCQVVVQQEPPQDVGLSAASVTESIVR
ncbi:MAG: transglutaminase domain-containing protein [Deltaproteobacteria bacterium]|nr:transglutaminase domain-containing protein [Deltaproteobacteria bacterium]